MHAIVQDNSITQIITSPKSLVIGDVRYPAKIFSIWSQSELNAIGIYEVVTDSSNKKDEQWYINTNESYAFADNQVTRSWGTATPKAHADVTETIDGVEYTTPGLKTNLIRDLKITVANELSKTDWYITRNTEKETAIPSAISTHRDSVRTKQAEMETAIINASDTAALETLYTYTEQADGSLTRPLGELPTLES
jgi:hypothetical protein|tara:strand:+ start:368 stop:952 length:585 start_codon:yes stop_codon:yes gene_type:complete